MAAEITSYYDHTDPITALRLSQKAPSVLSKPSLIPTSFPLSLLGSAENPEEWGELEQTFYACLRAEDDESAHRCLERLSARFGASNDRVVAMWGLYKEATAKDESELRKVLQEYNTVLQENPMNVFVHKRRIALIRSMDRPQEAISSLVVFLDSFPTDTEAWCELSDLYQSQGLLPQAIFSLEEAILVVPNAWNLQARLGELNYMASQAAQDGVEATGKYLSEAVRRFSRSIELCDDYIRGYYGLQIVTKHIIQTSNTSKYDLGISGAKIRDLQQLATRQLKNMVQRWSNKELTHVSEAEIIAVQALLDRHG